MAQRPDRSGAARSRRTPRDGHRHAGGHQGPTTPAGQRPRRAGPAGRRRRRPAGRRPVPAARGRAGAGARAASPDITRPATSPPDPRRRPVACPHMLAWIDLEMTGLDPARHTIVEIACLGHRRRPDHHGRGSRPGRRTPRPSSWPRWTSSCAPCTPARACWRTSRRSTLTLADAGAQTLAFLQSHIPEARTVPLAGNSIGTDRRFLATQLPEIEDFLQLPLGRRLHHQGAVPALAPRGLQGGTREEGRPPGPAGHPRERGRAGLLPGRGLRPRRVDHRGGRAT